MGEIPDFAPGLWCQTSLCDNKVQPLISLESSQRWGLASWVEERKTSPSLNAQEQREARRADKRQDSADLLSSFQPWAALTPRYGQVLHLLGMEEGRIQALSSTICLSPSQILTVPVFPCFLESSRPQSLLGKESQLRVDAHFWTSRLCAPQDTVLWAATSQPRPAWPVWMLLPHVALLLFTDAHSHVLPLTIHGQSRLAHGRSYLGLEVWLLETSSLLQISCSQPPN